MRRLGPAEIEECARIVRGGGVIAYPTDTVYGLGCDPFDVGAVKRLIAVKGERNKPLPILVDGVESAERVARLDRTARMLIDHFWPGALTVVVTKREAVPHEVTLGESVGVRCPNSRMALELIRLCGGYLIGTSANITGERPCKNASEVIAQIGPKLDAVLDGGETLGIESTVVRPLDGMVRVLRRGAISSDEIAKVIPIEG